MRKLSVIQKINFFILTSLLIVHLFLRDFFNKEVLHAVAYALAFCGFSGFVLVLAKEIKFKRKLEAVVSLIGILIFVLFFVINEVS